MTWRGNTDAVVGSRIAVHVVTVIVAIIKVRIIMLGMRAPPGVGVVVVMGGECK